jgi:hypothetical protein
VALARISRGIEEAILPTCRELGIGITAYGDKRVLDLQVGDGMHLVGPPQRLGPGLRQPDVAHVAGLHELGDGAHRLFDRHLRIDAPEPVDVDVVGAEAGQGVGERVLDRLRRPSMPRISPPGPRSTPNLTLSTNSSRLRPRRASRSRSSFSPVA